MTSQETSLCEICGTPHPSSELIRFGGHLVCPQCKPDYIQRIKEGIDPSSGESLPNVYRKGSSVVLGGDTLLPRRCFVCNHPEVTLVPLLLPEPGSSSITHEVLLPLCTRHKSSIAGQNTLRLLIGFSLAMIAAAIAVWLILDQGAFISAMFTIMITAALVRVISRAMLRIRCLKERDGYLWLKGAGPAYLETLAEWEEPASQS